MSPPPRHADEHNGRDPSQIAARAPIVEKIVRFDGHLGAMFAIDGVVALYVSWLFARDTLREDTIASDPGSSASISFAKSPRFHGHYKIFKWEWGLVRHGVAIVPNFYARFSRPPTSFYTSPAPPVGEARFCLVVQSQAATCSYFSVPLGLGRPVEGCALENGTFQIIQLPLNLMFSLSCTPGAWRSCDCNTLHKQRVVNAIFPASIDSKVTVLKRIPQHPLRFTKREASTGG